MNKLKNGDLVSLKSHPFNIFNGTLIGAFVNNTPPILVIAEVLKSSSYDTESEEIDFDTKKAKKLPNQYLCYFYSSKTSTFEKHWFKENEIERINSDTDETNKEEIKKTEDKVSLLNKYKDNLIVLKSADLELGKKKTTWSRTKEEDINKTQAFLEFLSPVMTVIDVVENQNFNKDRVNPKNGEIKRVSCKFLLKCKWFNPIKQTFSEEIMPYNILQLVDFDEKKLEIIRDGIARKTVFVIKDDENIILEGTKHSFSNYILELKDVVIQNHTIKVFFKNLINNKLESSLIDNLIAENSGKEFKQFITSEFPNYSNSKYNNPLDLEWQRDKFYKIDYLDKKGKFTSRIITNCKVEDFVTEDEDNEVKFVIANCLLRDGKIRHFRVSNITARSELKDDFKDIIGYGIKPNDK